MSAAGPACLIAPERASCQPRRGLCRPASAVCPAATSHSCAVRSSRTSRFDFRWLPEHERTWAAAHQDVLEAIVTELADTAAWPDPIALERRFRSQGRRLGVVSAVRTIPSTLGWCTHHRSEVALTTFGLACTPQGRELLEGYVATLRIALARYDDADADPVLTRGEVQEQLALDDEAMDVLSV